MYNSTSTSHNMMLFSIPRQQCVPRYPLRWLPCSRLFISPRYASVLDCHLAFTHLQPPLHSPFHVLQMAIVSIACDACSPVCLLYQFLPFPFLLLLLPIPLLLLSQQTTPRAQAAQLYQRSTTSQHHTIWAHTRFTNSNITVRLSVLIGKLGPRLQTTRRNDQGEPTANQQAASIPRSQSVSSVRPSSRTIGDCYSIQRVVHRVCDIANSLGPLIHHSTSRRRQAQHDSANDQPISRADTKH
jgi:hypothetical protein